ncbi:MAG: hypothetical protein IJ251_09180 [Oscillospiraceae bacterium]|nr:hypothetical protein [Oscillospiraceae bacterium]
MNKKRSAFYNVMNYIHVFFWLSFFAFLTIYLTLGILLIPSLMSVFTVGREVIFGEYDMTDSIIKRFFGGVKANLGMMRYFPLQIIFCLEAVGVYAGNMAGMKVISYICTAIMGLIITYLIYVCLCRIHFEKKCDLISVAVVMIYSLPYMLTIWLLMTLACLAIGPVFMIASLMVGALALILMQGAALIGILMFKQKTEQLSEAEEKLIGRFIKKE